MGIIKQARKAAGLSQERLAEMVGVSQGAVAQWEAGITHPSYKVLKPLTAALGITLDELVEAGDADIPND
jgi:transcriptional regulator with XRE-family HTH domain